MNWLALDFFKKIKKIPIIYYISGALRGINLSIDLDEVKCFSFTQKDARITLFMYNTACLFGYWVFYEKDFHSAIITGILASLVALFFLTIKDVFKTINENELQAREVDISVRKKLKDEYQRVYRENRKGQLLEKAKLIDLENKKNKISNVDAPCLKSKLVNFSYLDAI